MSSIFDFIVAMVLFFVGLFFSALICMGLSFALLSVLAHFGDPLVQAGFPRFSVNQNLVVFTAILFAILGVPVSISLLGDKLRNDLRRLNVIDSRLFDLTKDFETRHDRIEDLAGSIANDVSDIERNTREST